MGVLEDLSPEDLEGFDKLDRLDRIAILAHLKWIAAAKPHQIMPSLDDESWNVWMILAGRGAGKALCIQTLIPTPAGYTRMGDLRDGDTVFDERGQPCTVIKAHAPYMPKHLYRMTFSDGSQLTADGEHLWSTLTHRDRKQMTRHGIKQVPENWATFRLPTTDSHGNITGHVGSQVRTTDQIRETFTHGSRKDLNHCIPTAQPLQLPERELPVDPWLLGYWLGNGARGTGTVAAGSKAGDFDDLHVMARIGACTARRLTDKGHTIISVPGLRQKLQELGVLHDKHIPQAYLRSSIQQRLSLLQGLCDSDGYASDKAIEFCSVDKALADGVYELVVSLGERCSIAEGRATLNGDDYGPKYRVTWRWSRLNPFSLPRKREQMQAPQAQSFKHGHRMIVDIEEIEPTMVRCITVDSPSALYLAGRAMIPTHNTRAAVEAVWWYAWRHPKARCGVMAPTSGDLAKTVFRGQSGFINVIPPDLVADYNKSDHLITLVNGSQIQGYPGEAYERLRGPEHEIFWCDELAAFQYLGEGEAWDMMQFGLRLGEHPRVIVTTTPKPKDLILELVAREDEDVIIDRASTFANKENLAKTFIDKLESYKGTKLYQQEVLGEVVDLEDGKTIQRSMFRLWPASKPFPEFLYIVQSYDTAFTEKEHNDPTAATTWGVFQPQDGPTSVMLIDCWQDHLTFPMLKPKIIEEFSVSYGDVRQKRPDLILVENKASGISIIQELQKAHLPCVAYNPGRADKMQRLQIAATALVAKRVWLPESAKKKGFVKDWVEPALSQWCSFPDATHDDFCLTGDSLILMADGSHKPLVEVSVGDYVLTPRGPRRVEAFHRNGTKEVWSVVAGTSQLLATGNHRVMTQRGWIRVDSLVVGQDTVYSNQGDTSCLSRASRGFGLRWFGSTVGRTAGIRIAQTAHTVGIFLARAVGCTGTCGSITTVGYQRDFTFITSTEIQETTTSKTWSANQQQSIFVNIGQNESKGVDLHSHSGILIESVARPQRGIGLRKGLNGIVSMRRNQSEKLTGNQTPIQAWISCVSGVVLGLWQKWNAQNSVVRRVKPQKPNFVAVKVVQNTRTMRPVFDLTVSEEHCYFANGVLVHNCDSMSQAMRYLMDSGWIKINPEPRSDDDDLVDTKRKKGNPYSA